MVVNGAQGKSDGFLSWITPGKKEPKEATKKGQIDGLVGCAPNEGDYDVCDGQELKVSSTNADPSENYPIHDDARANVTWQLSVKDCQNKSVPNPTAQCDFDGDGNYDNETTFAAEEGQSSITVEHKVAKTTPNPINCIVTDEIGNEGAVDIYPPLNAPEAQTEAVKTQCDYAQDKPTISSAYLDPASLNDNGNIVFGSDITIVVGAESCDENQADLEVFVTVGPYNEIPMERGDDGFYRATLKVTTNLSNPATILVADNAKDTYTEEAKYIIPNTVSTNSASVEKPQASIVGPFSAKVGQAVPFMAAEPDEEAYTYEWSFGDGTGSQQAIPEGKIYDKTGTYTVILTVSSKENPDNSTTVSQTITIVPAAETTETAPTPQASIIAPFVGQVNETVEIKAGAADEENFTYEWSYGDSTSAQGASPEAKTYAETGTYTVKLTVTSIVDPNKQDIATQKITIVPSAEEVDPSQPAPVANLQVDYESGAIPATVNINASNSYVIAEGASIVSYQINFGDGTSDENDHGNFSHTYTSAGQNSIVLTITDSNGKTATAQTIVPTWQE